MKRQNARYLKEETQTIVSFRQENKSTFAIVFYKDGKVKEIPVSSRSNYVSLLKKRGYKKIDMVK